MKQNIIIFLLIILICLFGFNIFTENFKPNNTGSSNPRMSTNNSSSQTKKNPVRCKNYQVKEVVSKYLNSRSLKRNGYTYKYWSEGWNTGQSYRYDITQSGNTFIAEVSIMASGVGGFNPSLLDVGTFTLVCNNNDLIISSAFGIFDD